MHSAISCKCSPTAASWPLREGCTSSTLPQSDRSEASRSQRGFGIERIAPGHCTGWKAGCLVASELGDILFPLTVGRC